MSDFWRVGQASARFALVCVVVFALNVSAFVSRRAFAQKTPAETVASLQSADGFEVKLFAAEPMVVNPIASTLR